MGDDLAHNPWFWGLLVSVLAFILNTIRRLIAESRRMPREKKLELNLRGAGRALRKLGRARRILRRYITVRSAAPGQPMPYMVRRLWKASSDAGDAKDRLSAVLKKAPSVGCPIDVMRNIDRYIQIAEDLREECRRAVRTKAESHTCIASLTQEQIATLAQDCTEALNRARAIIDEWVMETEQAAQALAAMVDPTIWRSGGMLRNPFKPEDSAEMGQTESVIGWRWTMEDIERTKQCVDAVQRAIDAMRSPAQYSVVETAKLVGDALDAIDVALGDAELPLPEGLAEGETPLDAPSVEEPCGTLQRIYACLTTVEAALVSTGTQQ